MNRDNIKYVNVVIEESGMEGDLEYKPIFATSSDIKAKLKAKELLAGRVYNKLSKTRWEELKLKLEEFLSTVDEEKWNDDDGMYKSDAELIFNYVDTDVPLDILMGAEDVYENQDPYYDVKIFKMKIE